MSIVEQIQRHVLIDLKFSLSGSRAAQQLPAHRLRQDLRAFSQRYEVWEDRLEVCVGRKIDHWIGTTKVLSKSRAFQGQSLGQKRIAVPDLANRFRNLQIPTRKNGHEFSRFLREGGRFRLPPSRRRRLSFMPATAAGR